MKTSFVRPSPLRLSTLVRRRAACAAGQLPPRSRRPRPNRRSPAPPAATTATGETPRVGVNALAGQFHGCGCRRYTALGYSALNNNFIGTANTATGYQALFSNQFGVNNTANGYQSLSSNTTTNAFEGNQASGNDNTANGYHYVVLQHHGQRQHGQRVRGVVLQHHGQRTTRPAGYEALADNTTGNDNTAGGYGALFNNTTGGNNTASGTNALFTTTPPGANNTVSGFNALLRQHDRRQTTRPWASRRSCTTPRPPTAPPWASTRCVNATSGANNIALGQDVRARASRRAATTSTSARVAPAQRRQHHPRGHQRHAHGLLFRGRERGDRRQAACP